MASNHTTNFNLSQWEENDEVLRADFNADNTKIDAALSAAGQQLQTAQSQTAAAIQAAEQQILTVQTQTAAAVQAAESKTAEEATRAKAAEAQLTARCGNCVVITGTYTGNGGKGSGSANSLSFTHRPVLVMLDGTYTLVRGITSTTVVESGSPRTITVTWGDRKVSWYAETARDQCNASGTTYHYAAFLDKEG